MVVGCQPYAPAAFTPIKYSWYSFLLEAESNPVPQFDRKDFISMKNPLTPAGIDPATFRFVAQHLNHCATAVPPENSKSRIILSSITKQWSLVHSGLSMAQQPLVDHGLLIIEASRSHSDTWHSAGLFWKSDQPDAETSIWRQKVLMRDFNSPGGIQTRNRSKRAAAEPRFRSRGQWGWQYDT